MPITQTENKLLNELVKDCITYRLEEKEALQYIAIRFKQVSLSSYKHRKAKVLSEDANQIWLNHFTRIGFVQHHKEQIETIQKIQDDSLRQFLIETNHNQDNRNEDKIMKLKQDIRDNVKLLSELGLGTPIITQLKLRYNDRKMLRQFKFAEDILLGNTNSIAEGYQEQVLSILKGKPFWIWDEKEHEQEYVKTDGLCCFNDICGRPTKDKRWLITQT